MTQAQKRRLGRGLAALIGDDIAEETFTEDVRALRHIPVDRIQPNPNNPRKYFDEDDINSLAASIRDKGLLQPIVVRPKGEGFYEIVAGERRWRASQRAQLHDVPVLIRELDDRQTLEIAIIENIQRADLNPLEEAKAYRQLIEQYGYTQQQLADSVGKSRSHIANTLRLQNLPDSVLKHLENGTLSAGHARAIVATENPQDLAEKIIKLGLTVRQTEDLSRTPAHDGAARQPARQKDADTQALEKSLSNTLGLSATIKHRNGKGELTLSYKSLEQLDDLVRRLTA
jgi:ParB family transcriptional regulator, chromosome partitioning protein